MQITPKNILYIHQSTDLYGSDKTLLFLVRGLDKKLFNPIVVLPNYGPLNKELEKLRIKTIVTPVINIHRRMFTIKKMMKLPFHVFKSLKKLKSELNNITIDIVHSNTTVVCLGAIYAKRNKIKHYWHIHEIVNSPKIGGKFFALMVYYFSDKVIFNSKATQNSFVIYKSNLELKSTVIYNGVDRVEKISSSKDILWLRQSLKIDANDILLGLFGRINKNKGHELLIDAFGKLYENFKNIKLLIIGSTVQGQEELLVKLKDKLIQNNLNEQVRIVPFQTDIWKFWDAIDIAIVPSIIPESFGLVAVEAMLSKKPVIASNEGGLREIVLNKKTGLLFEANREEELLSAMLFFLTNKDQINLLGEQGYIEASKRFTLNSYVQNFEKQYH